MSDKQTHGRAVGAIGPGDVKKLDDAGLVVLDKSMYEKLLTQARGPAQRYPAELSASETEAIDAAIAAHRATLIQAFVAARNWQRQAGELSEALNRVRAERDKATARIADLERQLEETQAVVRGAE